MRNRNPKSTLAACAAVPALVGLAVTVGLLMAWALVALADMPQPHITEATATQCTTDAECEYWADRLEGN